MIKSKDINLLYDLDNIFSNKYIYVLSHIAAWWVNVLDLSIGKFTYRNKKQKNIQYDYLLYFVNLNNYKKKDINNYLKKEGFNNHIHIGYNLESGKLFISYNKTDPNKYKCLNEILNLFKNNFNDINSIKSKYPSLLSLKMSLNKNKYNCKDYNNILKTIINKKKNNHIGLVYNEIPTIYPKSNSLNSNIILQINRKNEYIKYLQNYQLHPLYQQYLYQKIIVKKSKKSKRKKKINKK